MLRTIDLRSKKLEHTDLKSLVPRAALPVEDAISIVQPLVDDVKFAGEAALRDQASRFDHVTGHHIRVKESRIRESLQSCPADVQHSLKLLIERLRLASTAQVPEERETLIDSGARIIQRWHPVHRVGLYAPGGKAAYPSSVIMNAVAAQTAGVPSIALASPAQADNGGLPHEAVLWAAALAGITEVYAIGGAAAIAAFAYGIDSIHLEPVDVVTGPGNIYVAAAKRIVNGTVGIDSEAGTTEILVIADETANPLFVAADLLSQAEHDENAASLLVTTSQLFADAVLNELELQLVNATHRERATTALTGPQSAVILVDSIEQAAEVTNAYAPEHLEIHTSDNTAALALVNNAGAIFVGPYTPVSLGDYLAGSNHVLPTGGTARFASGLGAHTFLRAQQIIEFSDESLEAIARPLTALALAEGLPAHAEAVSIRHNGQRDVN